MAMETQLHEPSNAEVIRNGYLGEIYRQEREKIGVTSGFRVPLLRCMQKGKFERL